MKYGYLKPVGYAHRANWTKEGCPSDVIVDVERYEYQRRNHPDWFEITGVLVEYRYLTFKQKSWLWDCYGC